MTNQILLQRMCKLIAMSKGRSEENVNLIYQKTHSIDETIKHIEEEDKNKQIR